MKDYGSAPGFISLPHGLWGLINALVEWRSVAGCPRSPSVPEPSFGWVIRGGVAVPAVGPALCLARSTAPRGPGRLEDFSLVFDGLDEDNKFYILALVEIQADDFMEGKRWRNFLRLMNLSRPGFVKLLTDALRDLEAKARKRGLL